MISCQTSLPPVFVWPASYKWAFHVLKVEKNSKKKKKEKESNVWIYEIQISVSVKLYWHRAKVYLHVSGYFYAIAIELNNCDSGPMMHNA